jgi:hypothetical protein
MLRLQVMVGGALGEGFPDISSSGDPHVGVGHSNLAGPCRAGVAAFFHDQHGIDPKPARNDRCMDARQRSAANPVVPCTAATCP